MNASQISRQSHASVQALPDQTRLVCKGSEQLILSSLQWRVRLSWVVFADHLTGGTGAHRFNPSASSRRTRRSLRQNVNI